MNPALKIVLNVAGTIFVLLGVAGAVLPLLPATPFLLLAAACYARGSERLHRRLVGNKYLEPYIAAFRDRKGLPLRAKVYTLLLLWVSLILSAYRLDSALLASVLLFSGLVATALLLSIKTSPSERVSGRD